MSLRPVRRAGWLACAGLAACAHYGKEEGEQLQADVYALKTQMAAAEAAIREIQALQSDHAEQLAKLASEVGDLNLAARRNDADFGVQIDDLLQDLAQLKGTSASLDARLSTLESATRKAQEELGLQLEGLKKIKDEDSKAAVQAARQEERLLSNPAKALDESRSLVDRGEPEKARRLLRALMLRYEKDRSFRRQHEARAQYLVGETYFAAGAFQQAAAEFNKVRKEYPSSDVVPGAYLRLGMCFERLGLPDDAKLFYQTVIKQFPRSNSAKQARTQLRSL